MDLDINSPAVQAYAEIVRTQIEDYKRLAASYSSNQADDPTFNSILAMPLTDNDQTSLGELSAQLSIILDDFDDVAEGGENLFAHYANEFQKLADYFRQKAISYGPSLLLSDHDPSITFEQVQKAAGVMDDIFQAMLKICVVQPSQEELHSLLGTPVRPKVRTATGTVSYTLDVPRFRSARVSATEKLGIEVDGKRHDSDFNRQCLTLLGVESKVLLAEFRKLNVPRKPGKSITFQGHTVTLYDMLTTSSTPS